MEESRSRELRFECINCGKKYDSHETIYVCPSCSKENNASSPPKGIFRIVYNFFETFQKNILFRDLKKENFLQF